MYLTTSELAEELKVSKGYIHKGIKSGLIPTYRLGHHFRFKLDEVEKALMKQVKKKNC